MLEGGLIKNAKEVSLVFCQAGSFVQLNQAVDAHQLGIMAGGQILGTLGLNMLPQAAPFDFAIANHAGVGGFTRRKRRQVGVNDFSTETFPPIKNLQWDLELLSHKL